MSGQKDQRATSRKSRLFAPVVVLTLGILGALVLLSAFLIWRFDATAAERERHVVAHGFERHIAELDEVVATQVNWDDAILNLDHKFRREWADFNIGNYLFTFNGFSHSFVLDAQDAAIYASVNGRSAPLQTFARFAPSALELIPAVRAGEIRRGPAKPRAGKDNILVPPIQANSLARIDGQVYIVTATLVQPDFGQIMPKGPQAPVVVAVKPINQAFLGDFGKRYLLDGLELYQRYDGAAQRTHFVLAAHSGNPVAALAWNERAPGTMLLRRLAVPVGVVIFLLCLVALCVVRRGANMVSELVASEARARHLAYHDPLTGLPNRSMLFDRLRTMLAALETSGGAVAVLCLDLDRFKEVNDTLGHHAGDVLIQSVAVRLRRTCGDSCLIARLGGDEFVVLAESQDADHSGSLATAILAAVREPIDTEYGRLEVSCSIGLAQINRPGVEPSEALRWADLALYSSKERGRMRITNFEPEMDSALRNRRSLETDLRRALTDGALHMVYQPQVDRSGKITAVEALVRWAHPERGMVPPGLFVPLAEECGLILNLGEYVLRQVFAETSGWASVRVAINVSAVQMRSPGFAALVTRLIARAGVDPARYEIELTETALLGDDPVTAGNVDALKRLGFSLALDDFGTGYSSLSVLQRFAVDKIKIDRSFVACLGDADESEALVDAMVKLARALNLSVIAEGVETEEQKARLVSCGCREFQGHLTGMPVVAEDIACLLGVAVLPTARALRQG